MTQEAEAPPSIKCEGCQRWWSSPYPDVCPRCDYQMLEPVAVEHHDEAIVVEAPSYTVGNDDDDADGTVTDGEPHADSGLVGNGTYFCNECGHSHKADSGIGIAHLGNQ